MAQKINQDTHGNVCVLGGHGFGRIVADPFLATDEQHGDRTKRNHSQPVMTGATW